MPSARGQHWLQSLKQGHKTSPSPLLVQGWLNQTSCQRRSLKWCWYFTDKLCSSEASMLGEFCRSQLTAASILLPAHALRARPPQLDGNAVGPICTRKSTIIIVSLFIQFHRAIISQIYPGSFIRCKSVRVRARGEWWCKCKGMSFIRSYFSSVF